MPKIQLPTNLVVDDDPWAAEQMGLSTLPTDIIELTSDEVLVTDETFNFQLAVDASPSIGQMRFAIREALYGSNGMMVGLRRVSAPERAKMRLRVITFNSRVFQFHPITRLFVDAPDPNDTNDPPRIIPASKLNVKVMTDADYKLAGMTDLIGAYKNMLAESSLYSKSMAQSHISSPTKHGIIAFTDGFTNQRSVAELTELRASIKKYQAMESWMIFMYCAVETYVVTSFAGRMLGNTDYEWYIQRLIDERQFEDNQSSSARDKAAAQLLFETMGTGYMYYVDNVGEIPSLPEDLRRICQLYQATEKLIISEYAGGNYTGIGGFGINPQHVNTIFFNADDIAGHLGEKLSESFVQASRSSAATDVDVNVDDATPAVDNDDLF